MRGILIAPPNPGYTVADGAYRNPREFWVRQR